MISKKSLLLLLPLVFGGVLIIAGGFQGHSGNGFVPMVAADDEGSEGSGEGSEDEGDSDEEETVTTYIKLPDQVIKRNYIFTIYDSDGDGVFDPDDPTPNVHNAFLVKDEDRDGIDDQYAGQ